MPGTGISNLSSFSVQARIFEQVVNDVLLKGSIKKVIMDPESSFKVIKLPNFYFKI